VPDFAFCPSPTAARNKPRGEPVCRKGATPDSTASETDDIAVDLKGNPPPLPDIEFLRYLVATKRRTGGIVKLRGL
jgi:hypothetical protein